MQLTPKLAHELAAGAGRCDQPVREHRGMTRHRVLPVLLAGATLPAARRRLKK